jgi:hypothetical protein
VDARHPALRKSASNIHSRWQRTLIWNILRSGAANNQTRILLSICSRSLVLEAVLKIYVDGPIPLNWKRLDSTNNVTIFAGTRGSHGNVTMQNVRAQNNANLASATRAKALTCSSCPRRDAVATRREAFDAAYNEEPPQNRGAQYSIPNR